MSGIRRQPIYISTDTWYLLRVLSKVDKVTPDEIADKILSDTIREKYPALISHEAEVDRLEKLLIKSMEQNTPAIYTECLIHK